ncbi:PAS domain S-box-containing protein [Halolactibacillus halophilus]|uniref:histidine kinase n=1 Tax=Halolactibacillus halophilus TaxID=306540 RepID=A0A1I5T738_9BACI|nr:PAS domain-containing protein [Halolactibacillus halophilus]SFP78852.1 PAS domain S-box-containing protein [Halolactibacillus halophilus]
MVENYLKCELYDLVKNDSVIFEYIQMDMLDGMWYWDLEHSENEWLSPKFWKTLGYNPEEKKHLSSEWHDIIHQEDLKLATESFHKHCENPNHPYDQVVRYEHKEGTTVWMRCRGLVIRDEFGRDKRMLGSHTDITDSKKVESDLSRLTREYEKVFNGTQDAMFLMKVISNSHFQYVRNNLAHQNKTGLKLEDIRDKTPGDLLGEEVGKIVSENYQTGVNKTSDIKSKIISKRNSILFTNLHYGFKSVFIYYLYISMTYGLTLYFSSDNLSFDNLRFIYIIKNIIIKNLYVLS